MSACVQLPFARCRHTLKAVLVAIDTVLITGATGFVGSHVVEAIAGQARRVRALVRRTSRQEHLIHFGIETVPGSLEDVAKHGRRLSGESRVLVVELQGDIDPLPVRAIPGVDKVEKEALADGTRLRISGGGDDVAARICALAVECGGSDEGL